jgi:hypothetical protein
VKECEFYLRTSIGIFLKNKRLQPFGVKKYSAIVLGEHAELLKLINNYSIIPIGFFGKNIHGTAPAKGSIRIWFFRSTKVELRQYTGFKHNILRPPDISLCLIASV